MAIATPPQASVNTKVTSAASTWTINGFVGGDNIAADDFVLLVVQTTALDTVTTGPSGFTLIGSAVDEGTDGRMWVYRKAATAGETGSYSITFSATTTGQAQVVAYRGVDATTPLDGVSPVTASPGASTSWSVGPITPNSNDALLVAILSCDPSASGRTGTTTSPATERVDQSSGTASWVYLADLTLATPAATSIAGTISGSEALATMIIVLRPAATTHEGASTTNLTFGSTTAGKRNRKAAAAAAFTFASTTSGRRTAIAAAAAALAFGSSTAGVRRVLGAASTSITFGSTTAGKRLAVGAATTILTFGSTTAGKRNRKAATTTVLTFTSTTEAVLHGAATTILTFGSTTAGVRTTFGESLAAFLFGSTTTISQAHSPVDGLGHMRRGSMIRYGLESRSARARSLDDD